MGNIDQGFQREQIQRIADLTRENERLTADNKFLHQRRGELVIERDHALRDHDQARERSFKLASQVGEMTGTVERLTRELAAKDEERDGLRASIQDLIHENERLRARLHQRNPQQGRDQMSTNELSDAELIRQFEYAAKNAQPFLAMSFELRNRLTARNAERDELRKVVERVTEVVERRKKFRWAYTIELEVALAPAQKEATVCKCPIGCQCEHHQPAPHDPITATAYTPHSWTCDCHHCLCFTDKGPPTKPAEATDKEHERRECLLPVEWKENGNWFHGPCTKDLGHLGECAVEKGRPPVKSADARHQIEANMANKLYIRSIGWGETTSKSIAKIIMDAIVQYAALAQGKP